MTVALIVVVFIVLCALMYTKKLNAMFALPIMALLIAIIAGIPWADTVDGETTVSGIQSLLFVSGPLRLGSTIIAFIFGAILSQQVKNAGIAEAVVRKVSEMAGDRPLILSLALYIVLALLFTTLGGLGAIMMLGSIVLPIMISLGVRPWRQRGSCCLPPAWAECLIWPTGAYISTLWASLSRLCVALLGLQALFSAWPGRCSASSRSSLAV